jgi:hypothetical protein
MRKYTGTPVEHRKARSEDGHAKAPGATTQSPTNTPGRSTPAGQVPARSAMSKAAEVRGAQRAIGSQPRQGGVLTRRPIK